MNIRPLADSLSERPQRLFTYFFDSDLRKTSGKLEWKYLTETDQTAREVWVLAWEWEWALGSE
jgi:hypothetical protein